MLRRPTLALALVSAALTAALLAAAFATHIVGQTFILKRSRMRWWMR